MIRKIFMCFAGIYIYLMFVFIQMDWFLNNNADFALQKKYTFTGGKDGSVLRRRRLAEFEYPEAFQTTTKSLDSETSYQTCDQYRLDECPTQCRPKNNTAMDNNEKVKSELLKVSQQPIGEIPSDCDLQNLVKSCSEFKRLYKYNSIPITQEERRFPLAFGVKMHHFPDQAEKILRTIYRSHNVYCIHVDQRADTNTFEVINNIGKCFDNIIIILDRENMIHSSYSHVSSDIKCMQAVLKSKIPWKYYINLSGQEFPLKTNLEMVAILQFFQGMNDIETYDHPFDQYWKIDNRFTVFGNSLAQEIPKLKLRYDLKISKGNPAGLFSRDFVEFAFEDDIAQEIINWFKDTYAPAENVWATLVTLPWAPGGYPVEVRHMISSYIARAMIFNGDSQRCYGRFVRGYCQFSCGDLPWLQSRPEFFASKLDSEHNKYILNCLFDWYRSNAVKPGLQNIDWTFYSRLPHIKYHRQNKHLLQTSSNKEKIKKEWLLNNTRQLL